MGHNGKDEIMVHEIEASQAMVEIKIKTLDSQTYSLRVDKCAPVPALKEQIATVTGVVTEEQRLICRGKVMKDDQLLSAYHVEDGHTLHLVVRQPIPPLSESSTINAVADPTSSGGDSQGTPRSRVVVGSFNITEQAEVYSDLSQIVSAVLGSLGISSTEGGIEGIEAMGPSTERDSSGGRSVTPNAVDQTSTPLPPSQPPAIPDSLTTLSEYLNHLRQEFAANASNANNLRGSENSMGNIQATTGDSRHPRLSQLAQVLQSTRQLLIAEVSDCFSNLLRQLGDHVNVTDPPTRSLCQSNILQSGSLLENVGISLLEIGRAIMMLRLGQTPEEAIINAGPAVYIPPTGRSSFPSYSSRMGTNIGGLHAGIANSNPLVGQSLTSATPRNIEIRIRTGSWVPVSGTNQREESIPQQTPGQSVPSAPSSTSVSVPSTRGPSESPRNHVALDIPVVAGYQQVLSSGERSSSTGIDGVHQQLTESSRQPQSVGTPGREGNSSSSPGSRGFSELRNRIHQFLRPSSRRENSQVGSSEPQVAANPSATVSTETNEAVANAQVDPAASTDDGNFISSILQQIMPFIAQNVGFSSSDEATGRGRNSSREASSREEEQGSERGESSRRREPPSPPDSKRQKRE